MTDDPAPRRVAAPDGTPIAVFASGPPDGPPVVLVHGATADHTTWRTIGPRLARRFRVHAIDRRGRGASGDGVAPYRIEAEFDDLAAVADTIAAEAERPVDVVGHSYGGRIGLGAALRTDAIRRLVVYEGAPSPAAGRSVYQPSGAARRIGQLIERGDRDGALQAFFREIVGMPEPDLAAYRADPVWPTRVAAVHTTLRELEGDESPAASLEALRGVTQPVLLVLGGDSRSSFAESTRALEAVLPDARTLVIEGARHAAHHSHPEELARGIEAFLVGGGVSD